MEYKFDLLTFALEVIFVADILLVAYCVILVRRLWKRDPKP